MGGVEQVMSAAESNVKLVSRAPWQTGHPRIMRDRIVNDAAAIMMRLPLPDLTGFYEALQDHADRLPRALPVPESGLRIAR